MEVVTGSSIIRALSSSGPTIGDGFVCKIDRQRLDRDGNREVEELLRDTPPRESRRIRPQHWRRAR
jgi:hypothetical protein